MTETRTMTLAGKAYAVPPLPLGITRKVYPLCRALSLDGGLVSLVAEEGLLAGVGERDLEDLAAIALACAQAAEPELTAEAFEQLPITPPELFSAFLLARFQTGMWSPADPDQGEAAGEASPRSSTSTASSPA